MATKTFSVRLEENVKNDLDQFCDNVGLSLSSLMSLFAKTVVRERRIPFEITDLSDPFYSKINQHHLQESFSQLESGKIVCKTIAELEEMAL